MLHGMAYIPRVTWRGQAGVRNDTHPRTHPRTHYTCTLYAMHTYCSLSV